MADKGMTNCVSWVLLVGSMLVACTASQTWAATDKTCLTGDDPSVAADAGQIAALDAAIADVCPCASFDAGKGKHRRDYRKCVSPLVKAAIANGQLRAKCKSRLSNAHKLSSCGGVGVLPCIEKKGDKIRCRILTAEKCQSDSRSTRTACASYARCVDAGDDNGDYLVDSSDSSECRSPVAATATPTATATETVEDTVTPTIKPTHTPTAMPTDSPTAVATDTPTVTPSQIPTSTPTHTPTNTATPTAGCNPGSGIIPHVDVNLEDDPQSPPLPPDPQANNCFPQTISGGGCRLNILEGSIDNFFDASASIDLARCPGDPAPSVLWEIFYPPIVGGALYTSSGIAGANGPLLTIRPNAMPSLGMSSSDPFWRVRLTITSNVNGQTSQTWFRFEYDTTCTSFSGCAS